MKTQEKSCRKNGFSLLEIILIVGIIALTLATILPSLHRSHEGIAVEKTARSLERCIDGIHFILKDGTLTTNRADITIAMLNEAFTNSNLASRIQAPIWPPEADLNSFNPQASNGPTINVVLKSGTRTVTAEDISSPR